MLPFSNSYPLPLTQFIPRRELLKLGQTPPTSGMRYKPQEAVVPIWQFSGLLRMRSGELELAMEQQEITAGSHSENGGNEDPKAGKEPAPVRCCTPGLVRVSVS